MWARVFDVRAYLWLGMRENVYLVTFILLLGVVSAALLRKVFFVNLGLSIGVNNC